ncbi:unnamed protein product [Symbiodinium sp. KB8]|nr:unnamed protein product [Symbiodinium sp. KB8]
MRVAAAGLHLGHSYVLLEQPEDLGAVTAGSRPSSMWQRASFRTIADHPRALHVAFHQADFGTPYPKPTRLLLATRQPLPDAMHRGLPSFDDLGFYKGPLPRHATAGRMKPRSGAAFATTGTEQWPSDFCKWVATSIFDDFLSPASTAGVGDSQSSETEASDDETPRTRGRVFRFNPVTESAEETGGRLGETEELSLRCLKRGYVTGAELLELSGKLPDETRIRESALEVEGQRSFTTGAYVHQDNVGLRRNLRNHRWTSELLARVLAASFPGKPFSSLALFRDLKQPAHRDSTNGPWENLLLACTTFEGGGVWVQADEGQTKRQVLNKEMRGRVLEWKRGWEDLRLKLDNILLEHAGGDVQMDRAPFEMAAKGELGCGLVSDPALHEKLIGAMVEHLQQKDSGQSDLDCVDPGQPFRLRLISALLKDASDPDWGVFLEGIEGFPVGIKHPLPRTREVFEPQTKWKLELGAMDVAQSWKANYESAEQNLDFVRSPGAREKRYLLRHLREERLAPVAITGDISKAHRRYKHRQDEWGFLGCKASSQDSAVYLNCVGTFGLASAGYWWATILHWLSQRFQTGDRLQAGKGQGHLTGGTDNQGNSYAVSKLMSTRFPLPLLLMEMSETLRRGELTLDLSWVPRERNQWADDLTNQEFGKFSMDRRLVIDGARIDWIVLGDLLGSASAFHAELTQAKEVKRKGNPEPSARGRKKARAKW